MNKSKFSTWMNIIVCISMLLSIGSLSARPTPGALAAPAMPAAPEAPEATTLEIAALSASELDCTFSGSCSTPNSTLISTFTLDGASGSGFLQSRRPLMGQASTPGAGLYGYRYQFDMRDMLGASYCVNELKIDFGPVVPLDYDKDGNLEHVYTVTSGGSGDITPNSVEQNGKDVTFNFSPGLCGGATAGDGDYSVVFGLASPFRHQEITVTASDNMTTTYDLNTHTPDYSTEVSLKATPAYGLPGSQVRLVGSNYVPGGYAGTIRWDGVDEETFDIPNGGAFSVPYTIPSAATVISHTISVCSGDPCTTGEFEQLTSATFDVVMEPEEPSEIFLPYVSSAGTSSAKPEPFSYVVDPSVEPYQDELPGLDGGEPRPLAAVKSPSGVVSTFVANELLVQTNDNNALNDLLNRIGGKVILEVDPNQAGLTNLAKMHLVRVDPSTADLSDFTDNITALMDSEIKSAGEFAYSSQDGVGIFALVAEEAAGGMTVAINWVSETKESSAIPTDSIEAASGPGGYNSDAYTWAHFAQGTTQDIGVPEAWNLLDAAGRTSNQVRIAILDGGFAPNTDFPSGITYISVVPFITDPRNVAGVDSSAPWHGTHVLQTSMAVGDNNYGIVGVAAPVGDPIAVYTSYDFVVSIAAVLAARAGGADILNMSYSAAVPAIFGWMVLPFDATTAALRADGMLLFAAAANDNENVDGEHCFLGICWEHTWVTPCENHGVICVGGLAWDSQSRVSYSNWGAEDVNIFAPGTNYAGRGPDRTGGGSMATYIDGTSFASPYAASVAALIWAGDPSLSANQVWTIMRDTAHSSPDSRVNRYVNAFDAVLEAVDVGATVEIVSPTDGGNYDWLRSVGLNARVHYVAATSGIPVTVEWRSNRDGLLYTSTHSPGVGEHTVYSTHATAALSEGAHTITVNITAGSVSDSDSVTINVVNTAPSDVQITNPAASAEYCEGSLVTFRGTAFDINEPFTLPDSAFAWRSNLDGSLGTGRTYTNNSLSAGSHSITLRVTDSGGLYTEDSIGLTILAAANPACTNRSPDAGITSPSDPSYYFIEGENSTGWYATVDFVGLVGDYEDPVGSLTVEWESDQTIEILSTNVDSSGNATMTARIYLNPGDTFTWHTITLRVTDTDTNVTTDSIQVQVYTLIR